MTKAEQETVIRWDQEERIAHLWTAYEPDARRWEKAGYDVKVYARDQGGRPTSWSAQAPVEAVRWRRVSQGAVVRRQGHRKGRVFGVRRDELVGAEA
jgi:hypothetical protein